VNRLAYKFYEGPVTFYGDRAIFFLGGQMRIFLCSWILFVLHLGRCRVSCLGQAEHFAKRGPGIYLLFVAAKNHSWRLRVVVLAVGDRSLQLARPANASVLQRYINMVGDSPEMVGARRCSVPLSVCRTQPEDWARSAAGNSGAAAAPVQP